MLGSGRFVWTPRNRKKSWTVRFRLQLLKTCDFKLMFKLIFECRVAIKKFIQTALFAIELKLGFGHYMFRRRVSFILNAVSFLFIRAMCLFTSLFWITFFKYCRSNWVLFQFDWKILTECLNMHEKTFEREKYYLNI